ncbi:hypothetical protein ANN_24112 [Periplaneta americana]|uniref:Uncharacterized protein n=1 Tax=Periplaneta americana TaxID=6978 RepID=A0ABQ8S277_PERAM|nr:hypothetical protein ANN_24112 [Periplaneta americana]
MIRKKREDYFISDPPSRFTIYRIYDDTGSVAVIYKANSVPLRTNRSLGNTAVVQEAFLRSPSKSARRY